jgi:hypothetical protein
MEGLDELAARLLSKERGGRQPRLKTTRLLTISSPAFSPAASGLRASMRPGLRATRTQPAMNALVLLWLPGERWSVHCDWYLGMRVAFLVRIAGAR